MSRTLAHYVPAHDEGSNVQPWMSPDRFCAGSTSGALVGGFVLPHQDADIRPGFPVAERGLDQRWNSPVESPRVAQGREARVLAGPSRQQATRGQCGRRNSSFRRFFELGRHLGRQASDLRPNCWKFLLLRPFQPGSESWARTDCLDLVLRESPDQAGQTMIG
jgi:hypothetical protein